MSPRVRALIIEYYTTHDVNALVEGARAAGDVVLRFEDCGFPAWERARSADESPSSGSLIRGLIKSAAYRMYYRTDETASDRRKRAVLATTADDLRAAVERHALNCLIVPYEFPWLNRLVEDARQLRLPLVCVQKEALIPRIDATETGYRAHRSAPFRAEAMCCPGPVSQRIWQAKPGVRADDVVVTGFPRFDFYQRPDVWLPREALCRRHGLDPDRPIVLFTSFPPLWRVQEWHPEATPGGRYVIQNPDEPWPSEITHRVDFSSFKAEIVRALLAAALRHRRGLQVVVKMHPWQKRRRHYQVEMTSIWERLGEWRVLSNFHLIPPLEDARQLVVHADLLVSHGDTMMIEAMIAGRPAILAEWGLIKEIEMFPFSAWRTSPVATSPGELTEMVGDLAHGRPSVAPFLAGRERIVHEYVYRQDGQATERVLEVLRRVAGGGRLRPAVGEASGH